MVYARLRMKVRYEQVDAFRRRIAVGTGVASSHLEKVARRNNPYISTNKSHTSCMKDSDSINENQAYGENNTKPSHDTTNYVVSSFNHFQEPNPPLWPWTLMSIGVVGGLFLYEQRKTKQ